MGEIPNSFTYELNHLFCSKGRNGRWDKDEDIGREEDTVL